MKGEVGGEFSKAGIRKRSPLRYAAAEAELSSILSHNIVFFHPLAQHYRFQM
jgi:hypothetical protein